MVRAFFQVGRRRAACCTRGRKAVSCCRECRCTHRETANRTFSGQGVHEWQPSARADRPLAKPPICADAPEGGADDDHGVRITDSAIQQVSKPRWRNTLARVLVILAVLVAGWLVVGVLRSGAVARDYFAHAHGAGATVVNVEVEFEAPAIPPFWVVSISGDVIEAGGTSPVYRSAMLLVVEPFTGSVIVFGAG
jgi:hypothetical protein